MYIFSILLNNSILTEISQSRKWKKLRFLIKQYMCMWIITLLTPRIRSISSFKYFDDERRILNIAISTYYHHDTSSKFVARETVRIFFNSVRLGSGTRDDITVRIYLLFIIANPILQRIINKLCCNFLIITIIYTSPSSYG